MLPGRHAFAVRTVGRHGIEGTCNGNNTGAQRDVVISVSVVSVLIPTYEMLVVRHDNRKNLAPFPSVTILVDALLMIVTKSIHCSAIY